MKFQFEYNGKTNFVETSQRDEYATITIDGKSSRITPEILDSWKLSMFDAHVKYFKAFSKALNEELTK